MMMARCPGRDQAVLIMSDSIFLDQQRQALACDRVLAVSFNQSRVGPFEKLAIKSPRLCQGIATTMTGHATAGDWFPSIRDIEGASGLQKLDYDSAEASTPKRTL
jgi:hypothetical protein